MIWGQISFEQTIHKQMTIVISTNKNWGHAAFPPETPFLLSQTTSTKFNSLLVEPASFFQQTTNATNNLLVSCLFIVAAYFNFRQCDQNRSNSASEQPRAHKHSPATKQRNSVAIFIVSNRVSGHRDRAQLTTN